MITLEYFLTTDWQPVYLSIKVAFFSAIIVAILGVASGYFMVKYEFIGKSVIEVLFTLPLVMPPIVTGFLLLFLIGKKGFLGNILYEYFNLQLVFTPYAAIIAGAVVSFPLMYQNVKSSFLSIDKKLIEAAKTLGASEWKIFRTIILPLSIRGLSSGIMLSFSRALGEFGATIMVAGNIPGKTQTIPLAIYFAAQSNNLTQAGIYVLIISGMTFLILLFLNHWLQRQDKH